MLRISDGESKLQTDVVVDALAATLVHVFRQLTTCIKCRTWYLHDGRLQDLLSRALMMHNRACVLPNHWDAS
jgi:predicted anti-sigma-YlaC factor YlaD